VEQWKEDIKKALELEVESVDCYPLDLYPETILAEKIATGELPPVGGLEVELKMYLEAYRLFKKYGYSPLATTAFRVLRRILTSPHLKS